MAQQRQYTNPIEDQWEVSDDDEFMRSNIRECQLPSKKPRLCEACSKINITSLEISFTRDILEKNSYDEECRLCEVVHTVTNGRNLEDSRKIVLTRTGDSFVLRGTEQKLLRLCQIGDEANQDAKDIPFGAPTLRAITDSELPPECFGAFIKLPKAWLRNCDSKHFETCAPRKQMQKLPRRLISVEDPEEPKIIDTEELQMDPQKVDYIAFSHKWGDMPKDAVTTRGTLEQHKIRIPQRKLPPSFRQVIAITHALGLEYLWIDTLCINQGRDGDFAEQADMMQTIFSGAYCVIAACNAANATDGILRNKLPKCVKIGNIFVSAVTNDFERDVLQSVLSRRGWVMQEHALARRTIFFTGNQMYFECGDGVRCETLTKLRNKEAAFLGDANFPDYAVGVESTLGSQIHLYTKIFQRYSRLEFSHIEDRPIAIDGLMDRLTDAFRTQSIAGLFKTFWGRCLLWKRAEDVARLKRIPRGAHTK